MNYKLVVTVRAKADRDSAFEWYQENYSSGFADRWYEGLSQAVESLRRNPLRCPKALENDRMPFDLYELLYGGRRYKHRLLFTIDQDIVVILRIWHSSRRDLTEDDVRYSPDDILE